MYELLKSRRSTRKFKEKEIEPEKLDILLKGALMSPSSKGRKPWELILITNKEKLSKLSECRGGSSAFLKGAPLGIVIIADTKITEDVWIEDTSIITTILQLLAHSLGLGSCWIQVRERKTPDNREVGEYVSEVLTIPSNYRVECMLAVGYPDEEKMQHDEEKLDMHKIHKDVF